MKWVWFASEFVRKVRYRMRFGELSRAPLKLLRVEVREHSAECEWLARASDPWDRDVPAETRSKNETFQALHDALTVRELLFSTIPEIRSAKVNVYRQTHWESRELVITGAVSREDEPPPRVSSLVMRAKLYGLQFRLQDGVLGPLDGKPSEFDFAVETSCHGDR
ncbi:MAG TPA: hypothetical protein VJS37_14075 [Terriglobales bacterium]|nr:hypothetical protein [Terriglobales bacterium]